MAIPSRILEQINSSEVKASDFYKIYGKQEVEASLAEIKKSDQKILTEYTPELMRAKIEEKMQKKNDRKKVDNKIIFIRYAQFAAAAIVLCAIMIPAGLRIKSNASLTNSTPAATENVRIKGSANTENYNYKDPKLNLYRQDGSKITCLNNGAFAKSGDVIQITYNAGNKEYGVIFSVDGNGNITRHFPEDSWQAQPLLHRNDEIPLDFSYELDNAPDFECFIMVTSKKQFNLDDLEDKIKNKKDIDYLKKLSYLPKKTEGITFVLGK